jgi:hypothetical protein
MKSIIFTPRTPEGEIGLKDYFDDCECKNYKKWGMNLFQFKASERVSKMYLLTENYPDKIVIGIKEGKGVHYIDENKIKLNVLKLLKEIYSVNESDIEIEVKDE